MPTDTKPPKAGAKDKGKEKATEEPKTPQKQANGKKENDKQDAADEELSEEDQQLQSELEMLVERLSESNKDLYKPTLEAMKTSIKTSTSSMTAVPKPLKFLRPHYPTLTGLYDTWPDDENRTSLADVLSVIGMTFSDDDKQDTLKYRLLAPTSDIESWGHEYVRHLALQIGEVYTKRVTAEEPVKDLIELALLLVPIFIKSNAEADAVDLMSELEIIEQISRFVDENTYARVCLYMVSMVNLLTYPDNETFLRTAHKIYMEYKQVSQALVLAIRLRDFELMKADLGEADNAVLKRQLAFMLARQRIVLDLPASDENEQEILECMSNIKLSDHYRSLAMQLNVLDARNPDDIYKTHLESNRVAGMTNIDSAKHNLSAALVNGFVNAGCCQDNMMMVDGEKDAWVWKTKGDGMVSAVASMGMLMLWDIEGGLDKIDRYTYSAEPEIAAGALLAISIMNSGVRLDSEPTLALLGDSEKLMHPHPLIKVASIMGLGVAYAGSNKEEVLELLLPIISDTMQDMQISAMAALSCGLVAVGSSNSDVSEAIMTTLLDPDRQGQLTNKWTRFMALGLGLLFFGKQEEVDVILETLKAVDHPMARPTAVLAEICAWAGTGAVLKIQELLHICSEQKEESEDKKDKKGDELLQAYAVLGIALVAMGEDIGQEMVMRQFGHLMHYGEPNIRKAVPLAMGLVSPSNPQMKVYDALSRYSHDTDPEVAINAIFAMGMLGAGTNNARLDQLLRQLASYYHRDQEALFVVRIAQGLLHMGKGMLSINPFHTDRQIMSHVAAAGLLTTVIAMIDPKDFIVSHSHYLLYFLALATHPRCLITLDEKLTVLKVNVRVGQAVDVVGQAGRPKTITGWQTQSTPVLLSYGDRAELEDEEYISLSSTLEGFVILRKNPNWDADK